MELINVPKVKMGLVAVSRDCFPMELSKKRLDAVTAECRKQKVDVVPCSTIIESEGDVLKALKEMNAKDVNAVTIYLGNFGPEGPTTMFAQRFGRPFMLVGAAEETGKDLYNGRGDAFCGMLSARMNAGLRSLTPYLPAKPIGSPREVAANIGHFTDVARVVIGVRNLKVLSFGPRPHDFYACDSPTKPLYNLGIEVMENSELDLYLLYQDMGKRTKEIDAIAADMAKELGKGNKHPEKLKKLAQYELTLETFFKENLGACQYGVYANKCWPGFEKAFGFVPCFINSRLASRGIPVACESDIFGAVSEYMALLASNHPVAFLDINNTVPDDLPVKNLHGVDRKDLFMGFHCGNTASCLLCPGFEMKYQLIMHRMMEPGKKPDITVGTLEGRLRPGPSTTFRFTANPRGETRAYVIEGHTMDADPKSFGCIGIIGCRGFSRFYRHVMLENLFPHHAVLAFNHCGGTLFDAMKLLDVKVDGPQPDGVPYPSENPFDFQSAEAATATRKARAAAN